MSSSYVRTEVTNFISSNSTEKLIDLDGQFSTIPELVAASGYKPTDNWVGLQFLGSSESPVSITSSNTTGKYREIGVVFLHIVSVAKIGFKTQMLSRAETLRNLFRGQRISGNILIEEVSPPNFGEGAALNFEGGYVSCVISINYRRDFDL